MTAVLSAQQVVDTFLRKKKKELTSVFLLELVEMERQQKKKKCDNYAISARILLRPSKDVIFWES